MILDTIGITGYKTKEGRVEHNFGIQQNQHHEGGVAST